MTCSHCSTQQRKQYTNNYRQIVVEEDKANAKQLFNRTCQQKQQNHTLYMKTSFNAQTRGDFCGIASIASSLHHLNQLIGLQQQDLNNINNQQYVYEHYVKQCLNTKYGISMIQLTQICSNIISDYNLPYCVSYVSVNDLHQLTKLFQNDIRFFHELFKHNHNTPFIMISNYWRQVDHHRGGHWSPIINISHDIQSIFIADVSSHRIKPHWIKINEFIPLMFRRVNSTNLPRGYIRIFHHDLVRFNPLNRLRIDKYKNIHIRMATNVDALTLSKIQVAAWKQTYRGIIDDCWLDSKRMSIEMKYSQWMTIFNDNYLISTKQHPSKTYAVHKHVMVICEDHRVLGYCTVGETGRHTLRKTLPMLQSYRNDVCIDGELYTLYLAPTCPRRQGFGGTLFNVGYDLIRNGFDWNLTVKLRNKKSSKMDEGSCDSNNGEYGLENVKKKQCVMVLWLLGDNEIAMKFYKKKGGKMMNDHQRARFGDGIYRYSSMVFGFESQLCE